MPAGRAGQRYKYGYKYDVLPGQSQQHLDDKTKSIVQLRLTAGPEDLGGKTNEQQVDRLVVVLELKIEPQLVVIDNKQHLIGQAIRKVNGKIYDYMLLT